MELNEYKRTWFFYASESFEYANWTLYYYWLTIGQLSEILDLLLKNKFIRCLM